MGVMNATTQAALTDKVRTFLKNIAATDKDQANTLLSERKREAVTRFLLIVWANQTADEQVEGATKHRNGKGFAGLTGSNPFVLSLCAQAEAGRTLSGKQAVSAAKQLIRHAAQIAAAAPAQQAQEAPAPSPAQANSEMAEEAAQDVRAQRYEEKARRTTIRRSVERPARRGYVVGPDGRTDSERRFAQLLATFPNHRPEVFARA